MAWLGGGEKGSGNFFRRAVGLADREANQICYLEIVRGGQLAEVHEYWLCDPHVHLLGECHSVHLEHWYTKGSNASNLIILLIKKKFCVGRIGIH